LVGWYWDGWPSSDGYTTSVCNQPLRPTQPPTLRGTGISTGHSAVMRCGWYQWLIPFVDKRVGGR